MKKIQKNFVGGVLGNVVLEVRVRLVHTRSMIGSIRIISHPHRARVEEQELQIGAKPDLLLVEEAQRGTRDELDGLHEGRALGDAQHGAAGRDVRRRITSTDAVALQRLR